MKKLISIVMVLCLLCTAAAALADAVEEKIPTLLELPELKTLNPDAVISESEYEGEWIIKYGYIGEDPATPEQLAERGLMIRPLYISEGKLIDKITDENGEIKENAIAYEFEEDIGELLATAEDGQIEYIIDVLEDGNLMLSIVIFGEAEPVCISLYMVHPEA
ncbi:MAG: hypothetical protein IJQ71_04540 [Clostridia bacterium]|jgi:hypothetical protein|nr:hypothetical protein [Clostridia bacterium]